MALRYWEDKQAGFVIVSLGRDDLLLESLREVARRADIHTGVLSTGIGSLTKASIHIIRSNNYPPGDEFLDLEGPLEIVQFGGIIAGYEPHVHISLWDHAKRFHGGHLEDGCAVLTLSEISIHRTPALRLTRRNLDGSGVMLLDAE